MQPQDQDRLIAWLAEVSNDPIAYVMGAFPWGEPETRLEGFSGPQPWQLDLLNRIKNGLPIAKAIQEATASGHGVGKSALVSWIIKWATDTYPDSRGVVTANTETQLKTKTWAELGKWHHLSITRDLFKLTATAYFHPDRERTWRIDMVPWSERNTEAFAGLHNQGRRILVVFDEASAIPDVIWETTEGALTDKDTQIIWCVFGNPTRNSGRFYECFPGGRFSRHWNTRQVDSREIAFTDKDQISRWIDTYGEDSDFVRIRVRGVFPRRGEMEFFNAAEVRAAMNRQIDFHPHDPLAMGVDVARYGANNSVIFFRKGRDARSIPRQSFNGVNTVDLATKVFEAHFQYHTDGIFIDGGGVGGGVVDQCRSRHLYVWEIQFGSKDDSDHRVIGTDGEKYANKRAGMYGDLRSWIKVGAIPNDPELEQQLLGITYTYNLRDEIVLEKKSDMIKRLNGVSPDDADALALTFAFPLAGPRPSWRRNPPQARGPNRIQPLRRGAHGGLMFAQPSMPALPVAPQAPNPPPLMSQSTPQGQKPGPTSSQPTFLGSQLYAGSQQTGAKSLLGTANA